MASRARGPSMHDVAARAGVSHQTVSRVLNNFDGIRPATRERVLEAIAALGYRRNLAARTLATGLSSTIGMLGPEEPNYGPLASRVAVERAAREAGFHALVTSTTPDTDDVAEALDFLLSRSIDALVLMAQHRSVQQAVDEIAVGLPIVYLMTGNEEHDWSISVDQGAGVTQALDHLTGLGHERIQHVSGPLEFTEAQLRRDCFERYRAKHSLVELEVLEGDWTADTGYELGRRVDPTATAVFCGNDQMAIGVMHALRDSGRSVPQDVSVVGFDDIPESKHSSPPLTTVHQDFDGVGHRAVDALMARLQSSEAPDLTPFVPWLVERSSTAPVA